MWARYGHREASVTTARPSATPRSAWRTRREARRAAGRDRRSPVIGRAGRERAASRRAGRRALRLLRLLFLFLLHGGGGVVLGDLAHALLELLHARAQGLGEIRKTLGAEQDQDDDEDEQQFLIPQTEHGGTP